MSEREYDKGASKDAFDADVAQKIVYIQCKKKTKTTIYRPNMPMKQDFQRDANM